MVRDGWARRIGVVVGSAALALVMAPAALAAGQWGPLLLRDGSTLLGEGNGYYYLAASGLLYIGINDATYQDRRADGNGTYVETQFNDNHETMSDQTSRDAAADPPEDERMESDYSQYRWHGRAKVCVDINNWPDTCTSWTGWIY